MAAYKRYLLSYLLFPVQNFHLKMFLYFWNPTRLSSAMKNPGYFGVAVDSVPTLFLLSMVDTRPRAGMRTLDLCDTRHLRRPIHQSRTAGGIRIQIIIKLLHTGGELTFARIFLPLLCIYLCDQQMMIRNYLTSFKSSENVFILIKWRPRSLNTVTWLI